MWQITHQTISIKCVSVHSKFSTTNPTAALSKGTGKGNFQVQILKDIQVKKKEDAFMPPVEADPQQRTTLHKYYKFNFTCNFFRSGLGFPSLSNMYICTLVRTDLPVHLTKPARYSSQLKRMENAAAT